VRGDRAPRVVAEVQICIIMQISSYKRAGLQYSMRWPRGLILQQLAVKVLLGVSYFGTCPAPTHGVACFSACRRVVYNTAHECVFYVLHYAYFSAKRDDYKQRKNTPSHAMLRNAVQCANRLSLTISTVKHDEEM
ncbi:hypothetical protein O3G_MSEX013351, partial [Manduca sexta]